MAGGDPILPEGFEWDEAKRRTNLAKHGIDFVRAITIFDGHVLEERNGRHEYGETRLRAFGESSGEILAVVYIWRGDRRRLISATRARADERRAYHTRVPGAGA